MARQRSFGRRCLKNFGEIRDRNDVTLVACPECGDVASIEWDAWVGGVLHVKVLCVRRHRFLMPAERVTYYGTDAILLAGQQRTPAKQRPRTAGKQQQPAGQ